MTVQVSHGVVVNIKIDNGDDIGRMFRKFEWASFINGGYIVRARLVDPYFNILKNIVTKGYLKDARQRETPVTFKIQWATTGKPTTERTAFITDLKAHGIGESGELEFVAIDPPSFYLNEGTADGRAYVGNVTEVIKQVVKDFAPSLPPPEMSETKDNKKNVWYMMRQDPKTFIRSLLDWSASVTPNRTHWIVASVDKKIIIKEQAELKAEDFGTYIIRRSDSGSKDVMQWELLADNFLSPLQAKLITSGISAVSGEYLDKVTDVQQRKVIVKDENTDNKKKPAKVKETQAFAKPHKDWATSVMSIPEHSAGDIGLVYSEYIDGRARGMFLNMLNLLMRMKLRIHGEHKMDDSSKLGVATCTLSWPDFDGEPYFLAGRWMIYGFHHTATVDDWHTDLYLARIDYDAAAKEV